MEQFANIFGISLEAFAGAQIVIIAISNALKAAFKIKGKLNLIAPAVLSLGISLQMFMPNLGKSLIAGFVLWLLAAGIWETGKKIAHKAATPEK